MRGDNRAAYRQAHPHAIRFRGLKRRKNPFQHVRRDAGSGVLDADLDLVVGAQTAADQDRIGRTIFTCRIEPIANQVQNYLLNLYRIGDHSGQVILQIELQFDVVCARIDIRQQNDFADHIVHFEALTRTLFLPQKAAQASYHLTGTLCLLADLFQCI